MSDRAYKIDESEILIEGEMHRVSIRQTDEVANVTYSPDWVSNMHRYGNVYQCQGVIGYMEISYEGILIALEDAKTYPDLMELETIHIFEKMLKTIEPTDERWFKMEVL